MSQWLNYCKSKSSSWTIEPEPKLVPPENMNLPDLKILGPDDELVFAVVVVVHQTQGGDVVAGHGPEWVVALVIETLVRKNMQEVWGTINSNQKNPLP